MSQLVQPQYDLFLMFVDYLKNKKWSIPIFPHISKLSSEEIGISSDFLLSFCGKIRQTKILKLCRLFIPATPVARPGLKQNIADRDTHKLPAADRSAQAESVLIYITEVGAVCPLSQMFARVAFRDPATGAATGALRLPLYPLTLLQNLILFLFGNTFHSTKN